MAPGQKTQSNIPENRKCTTKEMKNKWTETGVSVCNRTIAIRLEEMGFPFGKAQHNPLRTPKQ